MSYWKCVQLEFTRAPSFTGCTDTQVVLLQVCTFVVLVTREEIPCPDINSRTHTRTHLKRRTDKRSSRNAVLCVTVCMLHQSLGITGNAEEVLCSLLLLCLVPCYRIDDTVFGKQTRREAKKVVTHHSHPTPSSVWVKLPRPPPGMCCGVCVRTRSCLRFSDTTAGMCLVPLCVVVSASSSSTTACIQNENTAIAQVLLALVLLSYLRYAARCQNKCCTYQCQGSTEKVPVNVLAD